MIFLLIPEININVYSISKMKKKIIHTAILGKFVEVDAFLKGSGSGYGKRKSKWIQIRSNVVVPGESGSATLMKILNSCFFFRHREPVYSVAFSPDGKFLASGSFDKVRLVSPI